MINTAICNQIKKKQNKTKLQLFCPFRYLKKSFHLQGLMSFSAKFFILVIARKDLLKDHARKNYIKKAKFLRTVFQRKIQAVKTNISLRHFSFSLLTICPPPQNTSIVSFANLQILLLKVLILLPSVSQWNHLVARQCLSPHISKNIPGFQKSKTSIFSEHTGIYMRKGCAFRTWSQTSQVTENLFHQVSLTSTSRAAALPRNLTWAKYDHCRLYHGAVQDTHTHPNTSLVV